MERFAQRQGLPPARVPAQNDPAWSQWRRDQVSNLVRRIYLESIAIKPRLKVRALSSSSAGSRPGRRPRRYWRVYQDWDAWTREGIVDIAMPMNYKREHVPAQVTQYNQWNEWTKDHAYGRSTMIGQGAFLNGVEGTLRQVRRALAPSAAGNGASGVTFFSMATSNTLLGPTAARGRPRGEPVCAAARVHAAALLRGLRGRPHHGRSADGTVLFEDPAVNPVPVFAAPAAVPDMPWKSVPQVGHVKGVVRDEAGAVVDAGEVTVARVGDGEAPAAGRTAVTGRTDGNGFYGGVDLAPGTYEVTVTPAGADAWTAACRAEVAAGEVATLDLTIDRASPR